MMGISKEAALKRVMPKLMDSDMVETTTAVLAKAEYSVVARAAVLDEQIDAGVVDSPETVEDRQDELQGLMSALIQEEVSEWWLDEIAPKRYDNPERLEPYLGIDPEEWQTKIEQKAKMYRQRGAEGSDATLMAHHVRETFGVSIDRFEREVVEWSVGEAATQVFAGNFEDVATLLDQLLERHGAEPPEIDHES